MSGFKQNTLQTMKQFSCLLIFLVVMLGRAAAHQVDSIELEFIDRGETWQMNGEMDIANMMPESREDPGGLPFSREEALKYPASEWERIRTETDKRLRELLVFRFGGKVIPFRVEFPDFEQSSFDLPFDSGDIALISVRLVLDALPTAGELMVDWSSDQDTELIVLIDEGDEPRLMSAVPNQSLMLLKKSDAGENQKVDAPLTGGWVQKGYHHVIPLGLDHILFMLGLFLLKPSWKMLMVQSLLFTFAHSLTLALAALGFVHVPSRFVEIMIAVSIAFIGIENLFLNKLTRRRFFMIFGFGLLHGLGFASVLADLLEGVPRDQWLGPLLGFNVGVELAQISVLLIAFAIWWPLRKWSRLVQQIGSAFVALAGMAWVIERTFLS
ncbi:MAG: HupE/UreJ family protein [Verrucomicrobia bacterium]|nr:MAG: HupE/UreJ family protein [Verrucomicrobiota bacterium]